MPVDPFDRVHLDLAVKLKIVYTAMGVLGFPMRATGGLRTLEQQKALYAQGRTKPGKIVTKADGVINRSNHQARPGETFGRAVDSCFLGDDPYMEDHPLFVRIWAAFGACVESQGLVWGGHFRTILDRPHVELP